MCNNMKLGAAIALALNIAGMAFPADAKNGGKAGKATPASVVPAAQQTKSNRRRSRRRTSENSSS